MASADPRIKPLKIKTGVVKRLAKEKAAYEKEAIKEEEKVNKMKDEGKDEYDIRKQEEVLQETRMMIPDCQRRLGAARDDLSKVMVDIKDLSETEEFKNAETALAETAEAS